MADIDEQMEEEWVPPTEGELKILEARRERQDKISKLLGQYLIKGYKMLATTCPKCDTILMRTRPANGTTVDGEDYCVACSELDSDNSKDDPVLDLTAARSQVLEGQSREVEALELRVEHSESNHTMRMASGDGSAVVGSPAGTRGMSQDSNSVPATEARPSNPEGAVSSAQPMRMGRPDTGATQIESCTALGCLRKCDPPRVSSDESGSRARCAMMVICPSAKAKDPPSSQAADQPNPSSAVPVSSSSYHHHHHHHVHQSDYCPVHHHQVHHSNSHQQHIHSYNSNARLRDTLAIVLDKMDWASEQLKKSTEVEQSRQFCSLVACCAEAVSALKAASSCSVAAEDKN